MLLFVYTTHRRILDRLVSSQLRLITRGRLRSVILAPGQRFTAAL